MNKGASHEFRTSYKIGWAHCTGCGGYWLDRHGYIATLGAAGCDSGPCVVDTSFVPGRGPDFNLKAAATIPLKRIGTAEDVAIAIETCITQLRFATGHRVVVDGGRHLR